ncbi:MAG TPA: sigma-70 family RNA polymerase sigma factor, partial [Bryobacteraceae bacterium]|nr:sigma-70 family RNA polymerase sigma factor [Bryobacteraceae bacterium]
HDVTALLKAWGGGDRRALEDLIPLLERELHGIAKRRMAGEPAGHILQTTALLNEAYLRLIDAKRANWKDRSHFLAACSQIMRRILVDQARALHTAKRAGGQGVPLEEAWVASPEPAADVVAVDEALDALAKVDPRKARVVELRFFGGLSVEETAAVLEMSAQTVMRDWSLAKAWLARELSRGRADGAGAMAEG